MSTLGKIKSGLSLSAIGVAVVVVVVAKAAAAAPPSAAESPRFSCDVIPALTKAGCNAGACHGEFSGRGGFKLSLLGFDPVADYEAIAFDGRGRRVLPASPEQSLLLRKATGTTPHAGGVRLTPDQTAYKILRGYIAAGLPAPRTDEPVIQALEVAPLEVVLQPNASARVSVTARWSDGSTRDVTDWALFDARDPSATQVTRDGQITSLAAGKGAVSIRFMGQVASVAVTTPFDAQTSIDFQPANEFDELVLAQWQQMGLSPQPLCSDGEFLRRAHVDLIGTLPTATEVRAFLTSPDPNKRSKLVDQLLERPEYADYWSLKWADLLRVHRRYLGEKGVGSFAGWLRRAIRTNVPMDQLARELLTAQGNLFSNGPVAYFIIDSKPEELAETTAQVFLGVRLQCARCHHHPMEVWGQADYYGLAAFFTRLELRDNGEKGRFGGMQIVRPVGKEMKAMQVAAPPQLFGHTPQIDSAAPGDLREHLATWLTAKDNPFFARNFANRYWAYLMGRGLYEPIDDMRATNPALNPALLTALAKEFVDHGYDAKHLLRKIANSRVYQLQTNLTPTRDLAGEFFTHRPPRRMNAEVLLDAINQVTKHSEVFPGQPSGTRAISLPDPEVASNFLMTFGRPLRNNPCECARESSPDLLQTLHLINNPGLHAKIASDKGFVAGLIAQNLTDDQVIEEIYLTAFARVPTASESATVRELIADTANRREFFEDLLWTLLNTPEFAFNH